MERRTSVIGLCGVKFVVKKMIFFNFYRCHVAQRFDEWRSLERTKSKFCILWYFHRSWYDGVLGFYIAVRSRTWELTNASLKKLACLFHAFDKQNYLRMIPYHLADLQIFPSDVNDFCSQGCFSVSITGDKFYSMRLLRWKLI